MIHLNIEGKSWPEVTEQLAGLIRENGQQGGDEAQEKELVSLRNQLSDATEEIIRLKHQLSDARAESATLEAMIATLTAVTEKRETPIGNPTDAAEPVQETDEPAAPTEPDTVKEDAPAPATTTEPEPEQPKYKKEDVRSFLAQAREKGVNITDVLKPFGGRFPVVKEEDYPALMEATKKAMAEKGAK